MCTHSLSVATQTVEEDMSYCVSRVFPVTMQGIKIETVLAGLVEKEVQSWLMLILLFASNDNDNLQDCQPVMFL